MMLPTIMIILIVITILILIIILPMTTTIVTIIIVILITISPQACTALPGRPAASECSRKAPSLGGAPSQVPIMNVIMIVNRSSSNNVMIVHSINF